MIFKREGSPYYWIKIKWEGRVIRQSTRTTTLREAQKMESAIKNKLALEGVGIVEKTPAPTVRDFAEREFLPSVEARFKDKAKTLEQYRWGSKSLSAHAPVGTCKLDAMTTKIIDGFVAKKREAGQEVTTINRQLEVLRRMLRLAVEWGTIEKQPCAVRMVPGAKHRDRVLSLEEEREYLAAAPLNLRHFATILLDTALRPEELFRLRFEDVRDGCVHVLSGKTRNARRVVPMSDRVREIVEHRREIVDGPWVFAAWTRSGHAEKSTFKKAHAKACKDSGVEGWVLYTCRHTCLTRWARTMDPYTLAYLAGHSDFAMTRRYVHPQADTVLEAMRKAREAQEGHTGGHSAKDAKGKAA
jgi:integrase